MGEGLDIEVSGSTRKAVAALANADAQLQPKVRDALTAVAERRAAAAAASVLGEPDTPRGAHTGLRGKIAAGVRVRPTRTGAHIDTTMPDSDEAPIPRGFDSPQGWHHPVYGHRNEWVVQRAAHSWFMDSMQAGGEEGTSAVEEVLQETANQIDRES